MSRNFMRSEEEGVFVVSVDERVTREQVTQGV